MAELIYDEYWHTAYVLLYLLSCWQVITVNGGFATFYEMKPCTGPSSVWFKQHAKTDLVTAEVADPIKMHWDMQVIYDYAGLCSSNKQHTRTPSKSRDVLLWSATPWLHAGSCAATFLSHINRNQLFRLGSCSRYPITRHQVCPPSATACRLIIPRISNMDIPEVCWSSTCIILC